MESPVSHAQEAPSNLQTLAEIYIQEELQAGAGPAIDPPEASNSPAAKSPTLAPAHQQPPTSSLLQALASAESTTSPDALVPAVSPEGRKRQTRSGRKSGRKSYKECREYVVRFKGNNSKQWDGKTIPVDGEWLEELHDVNDLFPGRMVELPWRGTDGKNVSWKAVLLSLPAADNEGNNYIEVAAYSACIRISVWF